MARNSSKRIPISFSSEDFHLLYRVQEGYLYTGKNRDRMWQLADIIKAIVMDAWIDFYRRGVEYAVIRLSDLFFKYGVPEAMNSQEEYKSVITSYFASIKRNNDAMNAINIEYKIPKVSISIDRELWDDVKTSHLIEGEKSIYSDQNKTNFILTLNENELEVFDDVKYAIQAFLNITISYSEMVRILFRKLFGGGSVFSEKYILDFLSSVYIGALYDFSPQNSILVFSGLDHIDHIYVSSNVDKTMEWIDRDSIIFNDYYIELIKLLKSPPEFVKQIEDKKDYGYVIDLSNILMNMRLEMKYRSSISNFNFHSAFIGMVLISLEWMYNQHNPSLLATYLTGVVTLNSYNGYRKKFFGIEFARRVFSDVFNVKMRILYYIQKKAQDNEKFNK